jgi:Zn finger protein HypA/HybF involved in hydrogenase expression
MAQATCNNDDCDKDSWVLRKPLDEYKRGPTCPDCGTTDIAVGQQGSPAPAPENGDPNPDANPKGKRPGSGSPQTAEPVAADDGQQRGGTPATPTGNEAIETGMKAGKMLAGMGGGSPEEKAKAEASLFQTVGSMVATFGEQMGKERLEGIRRAKEADQSDISTVEEYVECPECDGQLTDLPAPGQEFTCPHCGAHLEA